MPSARLNPLEVYDYGARLVLGGAMEVPTACLSPAKYTVPARKRFSGLHGDAARSLSGSAPFPEQIGEAPRWPLSSPSATLPLRLLGERSGVPQARLRGTVEPEPPARVRRPRIVGIGQASQDRAGGPEAEERVGRP